MFDISWSELLILGVVTLVFVGPKELPVFLRTLGRYFGMVQRQAAEFRSQFDEAMREAELDQIKKDVEAMGRDVEASVRQADREFKAEVAGVRRELDDAAAGVSNPSPSRIATKPEETPPPAALADTAAPAKPETRPETPAPADPSAEKGGG